MDVVVRRADGAPAPSGGDRLLRLSEVLELTARGQTATLDDVKRGAFPKPLKVGRLSRWRASDVQKWIADLATTARGGT